MTIALADGQQIACATRGSGPDVVCVPGGPGRSVAYLGGLGGLDADYRLHLLDPRGSGGSKPADVASIHAEQLARDLVETVALLGLERPAILGHSFGTRLIAKALELEPRLARALVLVTPALGADPTESGRDAILAARDGEPAYVEAVEAARALATARPREVNMLFERTTPLWYGRWEPPQQEHAARQRSEVDVRAAMALRNDLARWTMPDLSTVDAPVLVVAGHLDFLTPPPAAHAVAGLFPDATYVELDGAGHFPWLDVPEAFAGVVADFLATTG